MRTGTWAPAPVARGVLFYTPAAERLLEAVDEVFVTKAMEVVSYKQADGELWTGLLSDLKYGVPDPDPAKPRAEDREHFPMVNFWEQWWQARGPELRDADGMELLRAWVRALFIHDGSSGFKRILKLYPETVKTMFGEWAAGTSRDHNTVLVLDWLMRLYPPAGGIDFALDAAESALALVPREAWQWTPSEAAQLAELQAQAAVPGQMSWMEMHDRSQEIESRMAWRATDSPHHLWLRMTHGIAKLAPETDGAEQAVRYWRLLRWFDEPLRPHSAGGDSAINDASLPARRRTGLEVVCRALQAGGATEADILEQLLGDHNSPERYMRHDYMELRQVSARKLPSELSRFEFLKPLVDRCRKRILEVELTRGDNPTAASGPALSLRYVEGIPNLVGILQTLGKRNFVRVRSWSRDNQSLETVMSHLTRSCFPLATETAADFSRLVKAGNINETRLVELAVYAPQWAQFVEAALGWPGLTEGVWWIHAHTKGSDWTVDKDIREIWEADMKARTALSGADMLEGGVDVQWFHRIYKALGAKRWNVLYEAAKLASTGAGHARAQLFADAMLGDISKRELVRRITQKRHQDAVRALGLLPLAEGPKRESDLLARYKVIQEFRRGSKQFGSQRQASEKRAAQIGQQNLARTAGFADPIRLEWAMEAKAVEDLAEGPIEVSVEGVTVSLGIDAWGDIEFSVSRDGKTVADIPAKLKKHPQIAALRTRKVELKRQASRIRPSLEQFMVRGDEFTGAELRDLMKHPLLAPMLKNLVLIGEGILGYPVHDGQALENHGGAVEAIKAGEKLRIAHPHDLLPAADWHRWQQDCFARERIQPFKQVFRELYPPAGGGEGKRGVVAPICRASGSAAAGAGVAGAARLGISSGGRGAQDVSRGGVDRVADVSGGVQHAGGN